MPSLSGSSPRDSERPEDGGGHRPKGRHGARPAAFMVPRALAREKPRAPAGLWTPTREDQSRHTATVLCNAVSAMGNPGGCRNRQPSFDEGTGVTTMAKRMFVMLTVTALLVA